jgi:hypothetical protein
MNDGKQFNVLHSYIKLKTCEKWRLKKAKDGILARSAARNLGEPPYRQQGGPMVEKASAETGPNVDQKVPRRCLVKFAHA